MTSQELNQTAEALTSMLKERAKPVENLRLYIAARGGRFSNRGRAALKWLIALEEEKPTWGHPNKIAFKGWEEGLETARYVNDNRSWLSDQLSDNCLRACEAVEAWFEEAKL